MPRENSDGDLSVQGMILYLNGNLSKYCIKDGVILFFLEFCTVKQKLYHNKFYNVTKIYTKPIFEHKMRTISDIYEI